jgi:energy-coupling factor transporter ATP-binding protein EcfA2
MYIDRIQISDFRNFRAASADFVHPDRDFDRDGLPKPTLPNVNLLLGDNGLGKTTLLKAIALAALGPAVDRSGIYPYHLIRKAGNPPDGVDGSKAGIEAIFTHHAQDDPNGDLRRITRIESAIAVERSGDLESLHWTHAEEKPWHPIYKAESDAFFFVGYGAARRVERREQLDFGARSSSSFIRAQRVKSLFEDAYSLIPLSAWLPGLKERKPSQYRQVIKLVNQLVGQDRYGFQGEMDEGEYLFERQGLKVPFPALYDGYRAYLGWIGDLLYHICETCPRGRKLTDNHGIVMVDEIDLHLHPQWQMQVLPMIAKALPHIQFIVTSHSPLIAGSLEWMNVLVMVPEPQQASKVLRIPERIHGLDADQLLLTDLFGLRSTRAPSKEARLKALTLRARDGDDQAALELLREMSAGSEALG